MFYRIMPWNSLVLLESQIVYFCWSKSLQRLCSLGLLVLFTDHSLSVVQLQMMSCLLLCSQGPWPARSLRFWEPGTAGSWPGRATGGVMSMPEPGAHPLPVATGSFKGQGAQSWAPGCQLGSNPSVGPGLVGGTVWQSYTRFNFSIFRVEELNLEEMA